VIEPLAVEVILSSTVPTSSADSPLLKGFFPEEQKLLLPLAHNERKAKHPEKEHHGRTLRW